MKPVRLAIIGCGGYAFELIKRIWTMPREALLVAATSRDMTSPEARACASHGVRVMSTVDDLLAFAPGRVDAILNPTPIHIHKDLTLRCLEAGFPVWLEKPPVATLAELDELLAASRRTGIPVSVAFNSLYGHQIQQLKKELIRGDYGCVHRVRGVAGWIRTDAYFARADWAGKLKVGANWVYDGTINNPLAHLLCNNLFFAAPEHHALAEPDSVEAELWHGHHIESEDTSSLRIVTKNGVEVFTHMTLCPEEELEALSVIDSELASISVLDFKTVRIDWHDGRREVRESYKENRIEMLENLCHSFREGSSSCCPLSMTRPFTQVVNTAFEQVLAKYGEIPGVPDRLVERFPSGDSIGTRIRGINALLLRAHKTGKLLGECGGEFDRKNSLREPSSHQRIPQTVV